MGKKRETIPNKDTYDRIQNFLDTYTTKNLRRKSKDIGKSIQYRAKNSYPTISEFTKEFVDQQGVQYSLSFGSKADKWYQDNGSERFSMDNDNVTDFGQQYFFIKVPKKVREQASIPDIGSDRKLFDSNGNVVSITVSGVNLGNRRATGELFAESVRVLKKV